MIKRFIIFLIRCRLHLKKGQRFKFKNQKTDNVYYFAEDRLIKVTEGKWVQTKEKSLVSLNWILSEDCEVEVV